MSGLLLTVLAFMTLVMATAWVTVKLTRNGGWTDVFWSFGTGLSGVVCALHPIQGLHSDARQIAVAVLVGAWSLRLGSYLAVRVSQGPEDVRYTRFRQTWGQAFDRRLAQLALVQAPAAALLCLGIRLAAAKPSAELGIAEILALAIFCVAILGEGLADLQMKRFKADPANHGKVADTGLWGWTRHPNYFFEWLVWLTYPVIAVQASGYPQGWLALAGPAFMYFVLTRTTGVPPLEQAMLASRGDAYRAYQARVPTFFPRPPKSPAQES